MAKYIKTEEGYKTPDELNLGGEAPALIAGDYIEIKDNMIRSTLGDSLSTGADAVEKTYYSSGIYMDYYPSINKYITNGSFNPTPIAPPGNNDILIITISMSGQVYRKYTDIPYQADASGGGQAVCDSDITIRWNMEYPSTGYCHMEIVSKYDLSYGYITIKIQPQAEYVTLPKTALSYDRVPTANSDNLVKSGDIYTAIQNATPNLTYDDVPTEGSSNLVTSGAIYDIVGDINTVISEINARIGGAS